MHVKIEQIQKFDNHVYAKMCDTEIKRWRAIAKDPFQKMSKIFKPGKMGKLQCECSEESFILPFVFHQLWALLYL